MKLKRTLLGYLPEESPIHSFHPLSKLLFLILVSAYPMLTDNPDVNVLGVIFLLILFFYSKIPLSILKFYTTIMLNILWIIIIAYTFFGGYSPSYTVIAKLGLFTISWENIAWAISVYVKMFFGILIIIFFLSTSREKDIIVSLKTLKLPHGFSYAIGLALRSIGLALIDFNILREAERARALSLSELPFIQRIKKFGLYIVPLLIIMLRRADDFANAIDARGINLFSSQKRTDYIAAKYLFHVRDYLLFSILATVFLFLLYLKFSSNILASSSSTILSYLRYLVVGS